MRALVQCSKTGQLASEAHQAMSTAERPPCQPIRISEVGTMWVLCSAHRSDPVRSKREISAMSAKPRLFLVVLGGRTSSSHIELHDVRWVVGTSIEDTIPSLRQQWFGLISGLHIDSYKAIRHVDGYAIDLISAQAEIIEQQPAMHHSADQKLWFINLGGYDSDSLQELHQFGLVVAPSQQAAKARARQRWLEDALKVHKDDLHSIDNLDAVDDCLPLFRVDGWHIKLRPEPEQTGSDLKPDWFGYWRIDGRHPKPRPR